MDERAKKILEARAIQRISHFSDDELKALISLIEQEGSLTAIVKRNEAFKAVRDFIKYSAGWITVVVGAVVLGKDIILKLLTGLIT